MSSIKNIQNISDHFIELEKRIRKVRFARIEAAKRFKSKNSIYTTILSIYSILITVIAITFSIVNFTELSNEEIAIRKLFEYQSESVIILALSSFITMFTLFISNKGYGEKVARYQSNYMELTRLLTDVQNIMVYYNLQSYKEYQTFKDTWIKKTKNHEKDLEKRLAKKYKLFADKYAALLTQSENHEDIDYKKASLVEIQGLIDKYEDENGNIESRYYIKLCNKKACLEEDILFYKFITWLKNILIFLFPWIVFMAIEFFNKVLSNLSVILQ